MKAAENATTKHAILDLFGANCTSCSIAIEHLGRKMDGVTDIVVDRGSSTIQLEYNGDQQVLDKLCDFVARLGYEARVKTTD
ncbi:MAG: heavy-metal-associated domain-containing protein [Spirochaetaceae bacterium]|nr:MAG: heavy-metal-associated domain-containing protein [Spirochaetaceae bacterium]